MRASSFEGCRAGYVFKMDALGIGYYLDAPAHSLDGADFVAAPEFVGAKQGFVFKRDARGVGYYRDGADVRASSAARLERAARAGRTSASQPTRADSGRGFRFGSDNRARTFRAYCERAVKLGLLSGQSEVDALSLELEAMAEGEREEAMMRIVERGLRGREVVIVGATGRTPRGWWGDESVGLCLPHGVFDARRPELLPVRMPLRSAALGSVLGEQPIPEVMDVGVRATNLRLRLDAPAAKPGDGAGGLDEATTSRPLDTPPAEDVSAEGEEGADVAAMGTAALPASLRARYNGLRATKRVAPSEAADVMAELRAVSAAGNRLIVERSGGVEWASEMAPCVLPVRLSIEHLWSGDAKTRLISRCCQLDILQCMKPLPAWPGQGPPADYVVNVGERTRSGAANEQQATWRAEARRGNQDFDKLIQLQAALARRGVRILHRFDSLFMRLYAARASIPSHRDEGESRLRIVGNAGCARTVKLRLQAIGDFAVADVGSAGALEWIVEAGWAYAFTDAGAGRYPLRKDVDAASIAASLPGGHAAWNGCVDLFAAHEVQPTSTCAPLTMAWVVDLDPTACGGDARTIVRRYEEAVLEVMITNGVSLDAAMEPPRLPNPFLYRPFEAGTPAQTARPVSRDGDGDHTPPQTIDDGTRFLMRVGCTRCRTAHWLPAQEGRQRTLWLLYTREMHAPCCAHRAAPVRLQPSLRDVGFGYKLRAHSGGDPDAAEVAVAMTVGEGGRVNLALSLELGPFALVTEVRPVEE